MPVLSDDQRLTILDEIVAATEPPRRKSYQFTRMEFQARAGLTTGEAQNVLDRAVERSQLQREKVSLDGHWPWVYWRPEDEPQGNHD